MMIKKVVPKKSDSEETIGTVFELILLPLVCSILTMWSIILIKISTWKKNVNTKHIEKLAVYLISSIMAKNMYTADSNKEINSRVFFRFREISSCTSIETNFLCKKINTIEAHIPANTGNAGGIMGYFGENFSNKKPLRILRTKPSVIISTLCNGRRLVEQNAIMAKRICVPTINVIHRISSRAEKFFTFLEK